MINNEIYESAQSLKAPKNDIEGGHVIVTERELSEMYALELTGDEKLVRDIFVTQAWMGQRIGDMINKSFTYNEVNKSISLVQQKTGKLVHIPVSNVNLCKILQEYEFCFPYISEQNFNKILKKIAEKAGMTGEQLYTERHGNDKIEKKERRCDLISSHDARHSFITNKLAEGWTFAQIKTITGHKSQSSFDVYNNLTSEMIKLPTPNETTETTEKTDRETKLEKENRILKTKLLIHEVSDAINENNMDIVKAHNKIINL